MASDLPSSPSSSASSDASFTSDDASSDDASSTASLSSSPIKVASGDEMYLAWRFAEAQERVKFMLAPNTSLAEAHKVWQLVRAQDGGFADLVNPEVLSNMEEALLLVREKLERLSRWKRHLDRKHKKVLLQVSKLEEVLLAGGPGPRPGYKPHQYEGPCLFLDFDQKADDENLKGHIEAIQALLLQRSPGSPAADGGHGSCVDRETKEQLDLTRFNLAYLQLKATGLELLSNHLVDGIAGLEHQLIDEPTHLGAGDGVFVRFVDVPMYTGEVPREP